VNGEDTIVVYDILRDGIGIAPIGVCLGMLVGLGCGVGMLISLRKQGKPVGGIIFWLIAWTAGTLVGGGNVLGQHFRCVSWAKSGDFEVAEGQVTHFEPLQKTESFTVAGITFSYGDANLSRGGFRSQFGPNGLLHEGAHVRVSHREGRILKLEILKP
jgi:hypothetical protein